MTESEYWVRYIDHCHRTQVAEFSEQTVKLEKLVKDAYIEGYHAGIDWDPGYTDDDRWNDSEVKRALDES